MFSGEPVSLREIFVVDVFQGESLAITLEIPSLAPEESAPGAPSLLFLDFRIPIVPPKGFPFNPNFIPKVHFLSDCTFVLF